MRITREALCLLCLNNFSSTKAYSKEALTAGTPVPAVTPFDTSMLKETKNITGIIDKEVKNANSFTPQKGPEEKTTSATDIALPPYKTVTSGSDIKKIPTIEMTAPKNISAWLGQTLQLEGKVTTIDDNKTFVAWILNGKVICKQVDCKIPLDGKTISAGYSSLVFIAYNIYGSSVTRHYLSILKGNWNPASELSPKHLRIEKMVENKQEKEILDKKIPVAWTTEGNAVQAFPETVMVFGPVPRNLTWEGQLKTGSRGVLRLIDNPSAKFFILGGSDVSFNNQNQKTIILNRGTIRSQSLKKVADKNSQNNFSTTITSNELSIFVDPGTDFVVTRIVPSKKTLGKRKTVKSMAELEKSEQFATKIVILSGIAKFKAKKADGTESAIAEISPGIELTVYEDGTVGPLERPKADRMEAILKKTISPEDILEQARKKTEAEKKKVDLPTHLKNVEELASREDYFEMLNELALVEERKAEDVRIPYYFGVANKGLYQSAEAEKYFLEASNQDPNFADGYWQLSMMYMDDKRWNEAMTFLDKSYTRLPSTDKRASEYRYYAGVTHYNLGSDFAARNDFMRALLWESSLEPTLKQSSADFFKKLREKKPWSIMPLQITKLDGNPRDVLTGASLPAGTTQKYSLQALQGLIFNWDPASVSDAPGRFYGFGATVMYIKNFPSCFKDLDTILLLANVTQTFRSLPSSPAQAPSTPPPVVSPKTLKITENLQIPIANKKVSNISLGADANYLDIVGSLTFSYDVASAANEKRHSATFKEEYTFPLWANPNGFKLDADTYLEQKVAFKTSESDGHSLDISTTPAFSASLGSLTTAKGALGIYVLKNLFGPKQLTVKISPQINVTQFITPWLICIGGVTYDYSLQRSTATKGTIKRPSVSIMFTGML